MGSRGRGALSASLLGSVSHYALNRGHVPVLIIATDDEAPQPPSACDAERAGSATVPGDALTAAT